MYKTDESFLHIKTTFSYMTNMTMLKENFFFLKEDDDLR